METQNLPWNLLADEEVKRKEDDAFGVHTAYAELLVRIARNCPTPFSIGLYSGWGTGKTSIVRLLQETVERSNSNSPVLVYLDVWKYSSDPLKRWILLETERQLNEKKLLEAYRYENRPLQSHLEFEEELEQKDRIEIDFKNLFWFSLACAVLIALSLIAWNYVPDTWRLHDAIRWILALFVGGGVIGLIGGALLKKIGESLPGLFFRRTIKHVTAKPTFSSEKFNAIFRDMVAGVTGGAPKRRLIFVFDNLDRCPADTAVEVIGVVKTFLDEQGCIYLIPCDEQAILTHIKSKFLNSQDADNADAYANQFLTKFFQLTLRLPPTADFAVEDYLDKELKEAKMEDLPTEARDVLLLGYRGETPRQVKRVLNDLIAYRGVAEQIETRGLIDKGVLTSDLGHLTKMAVLSVKWPSFVRKLADDPEKWVEVMRTVRAERTVGMTEVTPDLVQFLWSTRLVSPDADIRPWLYFSRGSLEKDAALTRRIEEILQNGAWKQLSDILADKASQDKKEQILQIASTTSRRWLKSARRVLLRNAGPLLLKASLACPEDRELRRDALDVLDYLATNASPEEMEQLFDPTEIVSITASSPSWQRSQLLEKYSELFNSRYPASDRRKSIWKQLIQKGDSLEERQRNDIATLLRERYSGQPNGESEVLNLLELAAEDPQKQGWLITPALLDTIAAMTAFDTSPVDESRRKTLVKFSKKLTTTGQQVLLSKISLSLNPARATLPDPSILVVIGFLEQLEPQALSADARKTVVEALLTQANRTAVQDRGPWVGTLIHLYPALQEDIRSQVDALFRNIFVDSDPNQALTLSSTGLSSNSRKLLLELSPFRPILRAQAAAYQNRYGGSAITFRQQHLDVFEPVALLNHPDIFETSLSWDLAFFVKAAGRAFEAKTIGAEDAESRLHSFCAEYLPAQLGSQKELYATLIEITEKYPEILRSALAQLIATCELTRITSGDFSSYSRFSKSKGILPLQQRKEFVDSVLQYLQSRTGTWVQLLLLLIDDVTKDIELSKDSSILGDLADLCFQAAKEKWAETVDTLAKVISLLELAQQQDYVDRALDVLVVLSAEGEDLPRMEPFLRLTGSFPMHVTGPAAAKTAKFVHRMLGAAKTANAKSRTLQFVSLLDPAIVASVKRDIDPLQEASESNVSDTAKALLQRISD